MHPDTFAGCVVAVVLAALLGAWMAQTHVRTVPPVRPSQVEERSDFIPYCPTRAFGQPQTYYPCMYSSREFSA